MTDLIEVKTAALLPPALDWVVAQADNLAVKLVRGGRYGEPESLWFVASMLGGWKYSPSTDWSQGGPLIDRLSVSLHCPQSTDDVWAAWIITDQEEVAQGGDTALIAACRAIVAAKLGDTVSVPAELVKP